MNSAEKQVVLHCLKSMIDEEVCEECPLYGITGTDHCEKDCVRLAINALSSSENANKWIPITSRPMTEEEKEHYKTHPEYQDDCRIFNCKLPDDGQEVLISVCGGVEVDTFAQAAKDKAWWFFESEAIKLYLTERVDPYALMYQIKENYEVYGRWSAVDTEAGYWNKKEE